MHYNFTSHSSKSQAIRYVNGHFILKNRKLIKSHTAGGYFPVGMSSNIHLLFPRGITHQSVDSGEDQKEQMLMGEAKVFLTKCQKS